MPETTHDDHGSASDQAGHGAGGHHAFDMGGAILHHNMPYPAWEIFHGSPIITFDRGLYAAINYATISRGEHFADADGTPYRTWAEEVASKPDFRYDHRDLEAPQLAKAMAAVDQHSYVTFPQALSVVNQQTFFGTVALLLLFLVLGVFFRRGRDQLAPGNRVQHCLEAVVLYLRDEVARPNIHHGADRWNVFLSTLFLMILAINLFGLVPGTGTMSGNIGVTAAWATVILFCMLFFGMKEQGARYWINLVPIPFSWPLSPVWFLLLLIELMGLIIKPAALAIRLFVNMFAGHTVLLVFLSLGYIIYTQSAESVALATGLKGFGWILAIAFHAMEVLVAFIQAYVFTLLSALFIGMSIHPEH